MDPPWARVARNFLNEANKLRAQRCFMAVLSQTERQNGTLKGGAGAQQPRKGASPLKNSKSQDVKSARGWFGRIKRKLFRGTAREQNVYGEERGLGPDK